MFWSYLIRRRVFGALRLCLILGPVLLVLVAEYLFLLAMWERRRLLGRLGLVLGLFSRLTFLGLACLVLFCHAATGSRRALLGLWPVLVVHDAVVALGYFLAIDHRWVYRAVLERGKVFWGARVRVA